MDKIINSFSTRETSLIIWLIISLTLFMFNKEVRNSIFNVLRQLFSGYILATLIAFLIYTSICVFILYSFSLWDKSLLKDTVFWSIGFGFIALMNTNKVKSRTYFKDIFFETIKWTIIIEFIANFFTFSLTTELIILPVIVFSTILQLVASKEEKHRPVEKLFKYFLMGFSFFLFFFAFYKTVTSTKDLLTIENLKSFLLPIYLSITFLPFMYLFNLFVKYEYLWIILKFNIKNKTDRNRVKRQILLIANLSIDKVVSITENIAKPINIYNDLSFEMIKKVSNGKYVGFDEQSE
jgi:hypothetical protein